MGDAVDQWSSGRRPRRLRGREPASRSTELDVGDAGLFGRAWWRTKADGEGGAGTRSLAATRAQRVDLEPRKPSGLSGSARALPVSSETPQRIAAASTPLLGGNMIRLDPSVSKPVSLSSLPPGTIFMQPKGERSLALTMRLDGDSVAWMMLTGERAYQLQMTKARQLHTYVLPIVEAGRLSLFIDHSSVVADPSEAGPGHVLIAADAGPCIAGEWHDYRGKGYRNGISIELWEHQVFDDPQFAFAAWTLAISNPDGSWVSVADVDMRRIRAKQ